jgi:hypothetical protein
MTIKRARERVSARCLGQELEWLIPAFYRGRVRRDGLISSTPKAGIRQEED